MVTVANEKRRSVIYILELLRHRQERPAANKAS